MAGQARILSPKEIKNIFDLLPAARDKTIFAVGNYTGLRVSEIVTLKSSQLFTDAGNVRHVLKVKRQTKKNNNRSTGLSMAGAAAGLETAIKTQLGNTRTDSNQVVQIYQMSSYSDFSNFVWRQVCLARVFLFKSRHSAKSLRRLRPRHKA
jgi:integrase